MFFLDLPPFTFLKKYSINVYISCSEILIQILPDNECPLESIIAGMIESIKVNGNIADR